MFDNLTSFIYQRNCQYAILCMIRLIGSEMKTNWCQEKLAVHFRKSNG